MKKFIAMALALVLTAAVSIGGTMAYLTADEAQQNTMTIGQVTIDLIEQERNADGELVPFTQDKPLVPAVHTQKQIPWDTADNYPVPDNDAWKTREMGHNVVDKFVTVKNTGTVDAFVRVFVAFEGDLRTNNVGAILNSTGWDGELFYGVTINGTEYTVLVGTSKEALAPNATTNPLLKQIYLAREATNEDAKAIDLNNNGKYDVLVMAQAVQADGFSANTEKDLSAAQVAFTQYHNELYGSLYGPATQENMNKWFTELLFADTEAGN